MLHKFFVGIFLVSSFLVGLFSFKTAKALPILTPIEPPTMVVIDVVKPVISNVVISDVTTSGAHINWKTNENSSSVVVLSGGGLSGRIITNVNQASVTQHSVNLISLNTHTSYSFTIKSKDSSGNEAVHSGRFTTSNTPLTIGNISINEISSTSVRIKWKTNRDATSRIMYPSGNTVEDDNLVTQHSLSLNNLHPDTVYNIRVESADSDYMQAYSSWFEFQTLSLESEITEADESQEDSIDLDSGNTASQDASLADDQSNLAVGATANTTSGNDVIGVNSGLAKETISGSTGGNLNGALTNLANSDNSNKDSLIGKTASFINSSLAFVGIKGFTNFDFSLESTFSLFVKALIALPLIILLIVIILKICKKPTNNKK